MCPLRAGMAYQTYSTLHSSNTVHVLISINALPPERTRVAAPCLSGP